MLPQVLHQRLELEVDPATQTIKGSVSQSVCYVCVEAVERPRARCGLVRGPVLGGA